MRRKLILLVLLVPYLLQIHGQPNLFADTKNKFVVQIGFLQTNKFEEHGTGLITYFLIDTCQVVCIITARHIIDDFVNTKKSFLIRPAWADSLKTTDYFGILTPLELNFKKNYFTAKDTGVDLGCILLHIDFDPVAKMYYQSNKLFTFPLNLIVDPEVGMSVFIPGYPQNMEKFLNQAGYSQCTNLHGSITWMAQTNNPSVLDNYLMINSDASHGNSGGPVFTNPKNDLDSIRLAGIVHGELMENQEFFLKVNGKNYIEPSTGKPISVIIPKPGSTLIVKASVVRNFIDEVRQYLQKNKETYFGNGG
ncbi:trypsin-like serine peptidase [Flavitalea flava]